ncbi:hypothetical protein [Nocardia aobensis]|uniref:hypothetical protein n=1 Tax=Nocardia aobensis TaxID=257277 RepID=UPI00056C456C|nr:hypothetical protein [Nocardia aobensis]
MQRNIYGDDCVDCKRFVGPKQGFIYSPGSANIVVCEECAYAGYGIHKGWLVELELPGPSEPPTA